MERGGGGVKRVEEGAGKLRKWREGEVERERIKGGGKTGVHIFYKKSPRKSEFVAKTQLLF